MSHSTFQISQTAELPDLVATVVGYCAIVAGTRAAVRLRGQCSGQVPGTIDAVIDALARGARTVIPPGQERLETHGGKTFRCPRCRCRAKGLADRSSARALPRLMR